MGKRYLVNAWVPHELTGAQKTRRMEICEELISKEQQTPFLHHMITMDESWIYWENSDSYHHRSWRGAGDQPITEVRKSLTPKKHLLSVFWDSKGVILMDVLSANQTITAEYYSHLLERLKSLYRIKRCRNMAVNETYLQHDNARPHTAAVTVAKMQSLNLIRIPHPPYSPDLAPSDFYLFRPMKCSMKGKSFSSAEEVQQHIESWCDDKPRRFFADGINKLPRRWRKCIEHRGEYFDHMLEEDES